MILLEPELLFEVPMNTFHEFSNTDVEFAPMLIELLVFPIVPEFDVPINTQLSLDKLQYPAKLPAKKQFDMFFAFAPQKVPKNTELPTSLAPAAEFTPKLELFDVPNAVAFDGLFPALQPIYTFALLSPMFT
jgi:hypothetical protein